MGVIAAAGLSMIEDPPEWLSTRTQRVEAMAIAGLDGLAAITNGLITQHLHHTVRSAIVSAEAAQ